MLLGDEETGTRLYRALTMLNSLPEVNEDKRKVVDARYTNGIAFTEIDQPVVAME